MIASFLIVNFNTYQDVRDAIHEIHRNAKKFEYEIIVFDNASTDGSHEYLENLKDPKVKVLLSDKNIGYGSGNNRAAKIASGELLVLVNPDIGEIDGDLLQFLEKYRNSKVGAWAPAVLYMDGSIQPSGGGESTPWTFIFQSLKLGAMVRRLGLIKLVRLAVKILPFLKSTIIGSYVENFNLKEKKNSVKAWHWLSGAFLVVPKQVFQLVGGFDENFFLYNEDEDLGVRIRQMGYHIIQDRSLAVVHTVGGSQKTQASDRLGRAYVERMVSRIYYAQKYFSKRSYLFLRLYFFFYCNFFAFLNVLILRLYKAKDYIALGKRILSFKPLSPKTQEKELAT